MHMYAFTEHVFCTLELLSGFVEEYLSIYHLEIIVERKGIGAVS